MSISPLDALVWFPMLFDSFSASLAGSIGRFGGFIFFQSVLTIYGTFTVVSVLISMLAVIVKLSSLTMVWQTLWTTSMTALGTGMIMVQIAVFSLQIGYIGY